MSPQRFSSSERRLTAVCESTGGAVSAIRPRAQLARATIALYDTLVAVAALVVALAGVDDLAGVAEIGVDAT